MSGSAPQEPEPALKCVKCSQETIQVLGICDGCVGSFEPAEDMDRIKRLEQDHTKHCARRLVWGDGICECAPREPQSLSPPCTVEGDSKLPTNSGAEPAHHGECRCSAWFTHGGRCVMCHGLIRPTGAEPAPRETGIPKCDSCGHFKTLHGIAGCVAYTEDVSCQCGWEKQQPCVDGCERPRGHKPPHSPRAPRETEPRARERCRATYIDSCESHGCGLQEGHAGAHKWMTGVELAALREPRRWTREEVEAALQRGFERGPWDKDDFWRALDGEGET